MNIIQIRVRELLEENKESQKWLSKKSGVTEATISRIVKGISIPGGDVLGAIAEAFEVSADYLLGRTEDRRLRGRKEEIEFFVGRAYGRCDRRDKRILLAVLDGYLSKEEMALLMDDLTDRKGGNEDAGANR